MCKNISRGISIVVLLMLISGCQELTIFDDVDKQKFFDQAVGGYDSKVDPDSFLVVNKDKVFSGNAKLGEYEIKINKLNSLRDQFYICDKNGGKSRALTIDTTCEDVQVYKDGGYASSSFEGDCEIVKKRIPLQTQEVGRQTSCFTPTNFPHGNCQGQLGSKWVRIGCISANRELCGVVGDDFKGGEIPDPDCEFFDETVYDCVGEYEIFKDGKLIRKINATDQKNIQLEDNGFFLTFNQNSEYWRSGDFSPINWRCLRLRSSYYYEVPKDSIKIEVLPVDDLLFEGQTYVSKIKVTNNWRKIKGDLSVLYQVPTVIGTKDFVDSRIVEIEKGINTYEYEIPISKATDKIIISPEILILDDVSNFAGVNANCDGEVQNVKNCDQVNLDVLSGGSFEVQVIPRPLYLDYDGFECTTLDGYLPSPSREYCLRNDISDITCTQTGCPDSEDYICTSSGFCSQIISGGQCESDEDCSGVGGVCQNDDSGSKRVCVKKEIKEIVTIITEEKQISCSNFNPCDESRGYTCVDSVGGNFKCELDECRIVCKMKKLFERILSFFR